MVAFMIMNKISTQSTKKSSLEVFQNRMTLILRIGILLALFTLSSLAYQPQKTIQETCYEKTIFQQKPCIKNPEGSLSRSPNANSNQLSVEYWFHVRAVHDSTAH
jgi:hypothetical protein